jgi:antirestriction protein ArdC
MHRDLYCEVTNRIIAALDAGVTPWIQPWSTGFEPTPINAASRRCYRGINTVLLTLEAQSRGFNRNAWLTYRQAAELGAHVRAGESGCVVVFYKLHELPHPTSVEKLEDEPAPKVIPLLRAYTVFNLEQVDALPKRLREREALATWHPEESAERLLKESQADIRHGGAMAYYDPRDDRIQLPNRENFDDSAGYYSTAMHELVHWTGHAKRLDRQLGRRFGNAAYAAEELVAEMGSAFLCASCYLEGRLRHASYIADWLELLKSDKRAIFAAAAKAQHAVDFIESVCGNPPIAVTSNMAWKKQEAGTA